MTGVGLIKTDGAGVVLVIPPPSKYRILKFILNLFVPISFLLIGDSTWIPVMRSGSKFR